MLPRVVTSQSNDAALLVVSDFCGVRLLAEQPKWKALLLFVLVVVVVIMPPDLLWRNDI